MPKPRKYTRAEQKQISVLEKRFPFSLADAAAGCGWKVCGCGIYRAEGPYHFEGNMTLSSTAALQDQIRITAQLGVKLAALDDVFWEVFARTTRPRKTDTAIVKAPVLAFNTAASNHPPNEQYLRIACAGLLEGLNEAVKVFQSQGWTIRNFGTFVLSERERLPDWLRESHDLHQGDSMLILMLLAILQRDHTKALKLAEQELALGFRGMYHYRRKSIYQYIAEYCRRARQSTALPAT